jgi:hypothetical protein
VTINLLEQEKPHMADRIYGCDKIRSNPSLPDHCDWSTEWLGTRAMHRAWPVSARA